jgi:hypothetical protein
VMVGVVGGWWLRGLSKVGQKWGFVALWLLGFLLSIPTRL